MAHPSIGPTEVKKRARWAYEYLSARDPEVEWVQFHETNWGNSDLIPRSDKPFGWTAVATDDDGNIKVRFCAQRIADATKRMPFKPDNKTRFRVASIEPQEPEGADPLIAQFEVERDAGVSSMWFADNYIRAVGRLLVYEIALIPIEGDPAARRAAAEAALYDESPAALALLSEVQLQLI